MGDAASVEAVMARLERIATDLSPSDGVKWFALIYLEATRAVAAALERGEFESTTFMPRLVIRFGNAFFAAVEGTQMLSNAWLPVFEARYDPGIAPLQFAIAGYNSQMGYEMPLGLVAAWRDLGAEPGEDTPERRDFDRLNSTAGSVHPRVREYLETDAVQLVGRRFEGVDEVVESWNQQEARAAAWAQGAALWRLWDDYRLVTPYLASLDRNVGLVSKLLLTPTGA